MGISFKEFQDMTKICNCRLPSEEEEDEWKNMCGSPKQPKENDKARLESVVYAVAIRQFFKLSGGDASRHAIHTELYIPHGHKSHSRPKSPIISTAFHATPLP